MCYGTAAAKNADRDMIPELLDAIEDAQMRRGAVHLARQTALAAARQRKHLRLVSSNGRTKPKE